MNHQKAAQKSSQPASALQAAGGLLQRKCACGQHTNGGECEECKKQLGMLRWHAASLDYHPMVPPIVQDVLRSPGLPLGAAPRAFFEPRFGHDFTNVRLHTDSRASESARACNALAYTVGNDVVFATGQYRPETAEGKRLLAHELAHIVQQHHGGSHMLQHLQISATDDPTERQADSIAESIISGSRPTSIHRVGLMLRRQGTGPAPTTTQPGAGASARAPVAAEGGGGSLCATYADEESLSRDPGFCKDTRSSGRLHNVDGCKDTRSSGRLHHADAIACYREVPTGSGCPPGKHICFEAGVCDRKETHIDSTAPTMKRDANGCCDMSYLGACSILHGIKDVVKWKGVGIGAGLGALVGGGLGALLGGGTGAAIGAGLGGLAGGVAGQFV